LEWLKPVDYEILSQLIKNSKISDRKLAGKLGVSQPTVTRKRAKMEKAELIDYTAVPNFAKLGFEILAFNFVSYSPGMQGQVGENKDLEQKLRTTLSENPNMIFVSSGRGVGFDGVAVSIHRNYSDYSEFIKTLRLEWGAHVGSIDSFVVSLKSDNVLRQFTFKHLANQISEE